MPGPRFPEPCMCGDPYCGTCGPLQGYDNSDHEDEDEAYERFRQEEIDNESDRSN